MSAFDVRECYSEIPRNEAHSLIDVRIVKARTYLDFGNLCSGFDFVLLMNNSV